MVQATRIVLVALALCVAFVAPAVASRQLKQTGRTILFPGCSFLSDSEIAKNEDFSTLFMLLERTGLNDTLANLTTPHTLFAPTNDAFAEFLMAVNITVEEALAETVSDLLLGHVVPANVQDALVCIGCPASAALIAPDVCVSAGPDCTTPSKWHFLAQLSVLLP